MSIDTAEKRYSMINFTVVGAGKILFVPTGTVNDQDRFHLLGLYSGLAPFPPPTPGRLSGYIGIPGIAFARPVMDGTTIG